MNYFHPSLYNVDAILHRGLEVQCGLPDGRWVAARPLGCPTISERFRLAWGVFTGRYDAIEWTGQE